MIWVILLVMSNVFWIVVATYFALKVKKQDLYILKFIKLAKLIDVEIKKKEAEIAKQLILKSEINIELDDTHRELH